MSPARMRGFTLIEVLVALLIFASLSLGAYQLLTAVLHNDEMAREKVAQLGELQRVFGMMERDFSQMIARPTRVNGEASSAVIQTGQFQMQSDDWSILFVRGGWFNPGAQLPRSQLQKVGYRLREEKLERLSYVYLDPVVGTEPTATVLLDGVKSFRLRFFHNGQWASAWNSTSQLPKAVEVELELTHYGKIRRLFLIASESTTS
ncbi:type II secretion system minor pseudopilin GspJ [Pseudaeromonas sharmana]|uniref:Type II secretion system protein J n=1 Tax=Pseudaeromonas sharmana TaxID=328412 RepID=A0ABV8CKC6_9GAMM